MIRNSPAHERIPVGPLAAAVQAYLADVDQTPNVLWPLVDAQLGYRPSAQSRSTMARRWCEIERRGWISLRHADAICCVIGLRLDDVAPPVSMDDVGEGWCPGCRSVVTTVGGRCAWCDEAAA